MGSKKWEVPSRHTVWEFDEDAPVGAEAEAILSERGTEEIAAELLVAYRGDTCGGRPNFYVRTNRQRRRSLRLASPEKDRRSVVIVVVDRPVLGLSIGLPAPLGEPDPSQEGGEPDHPYRHQKGPPPALGIPIREGQEKTEQHPGEHVCSPARHSTPARKYGLHAQRVPLAAIHASTLRRLEKLAE